MKVSKFSKRDLINLEEFKYYSKPKLTKWVIENSFFDTKQRLYILKDSQTDYPEIDYTKLDLKNLTQSNRELVSLFLYCFCHLKILPKDMSNDLLLNITMRYLELKRNKAKEIALVLKVLSQDIRR